MDTSRSWEVGTKSNILVLTHKNLSINYKYYKREVVAMGTTNRKYTHINFDQVVSDLKQILAAKEGPLADLGDSSYGTTLIELFSANADLIAGWAEAAFNDSYLESATSTSSIYVGARSLGYSIRRPVPAKAGFGISLQRTGIYSDVKVTIPSGTQFQVDGQVLTALDDMEFLYERDNTSFQDGIMRLVSGRAVLAQGNIATERFFSDGSQNQEFLINDPFASNWFGSDDPNYNGIETQEQLQNMFTIVSSDASLTENVEGANGTEDKIYWRISRRGFQDPTNDTTVNDIDNFQQSPNVTTNYTTLITTANDGRMRVEFSDGVISAIPFGEILVQYFTTQGELGNRLNIAGSTLTTDSTSILITQGDGSESDLIVSDLNFALTTDITGGLNIESNASIKANASSIYNSLDSLGSRASYLTFLKRYADIVYANAYGEDILNRRTANGLPNVKYSNIVRFTGLKDLYRERDGKFFPTDPFEYYLQGYKVNGLTYLWQYDYNDIQPFIDANEANELRANIQQELTADGIKICKPNSSNECIPLSIPDFIQQYLALGPSISLVPVQVFNANLTPLDFVEEGSELEVILDAINRRGYITLGSGQTSYEPPIVHDMTVKMDVILFEGANFSDIKTRIRNALYQYLKENSNFNKTFYRSKFEAIVQNFTEVAGVNLFFRQLNNEFEGLDLTTLTWLGDDTSQYINQTGLPFEGFDISLTYNYFFKDNNGNEIENPDETVTFNVGSQTKIQARISEYYKSNIAGSRTVEGGYPPRVDLTEDDINKFTSYIWAQMLNEIYVPLFNLYRDTLASGDVITANSYYNVLESIKGWFFDDGRLSFKNTDQIKNMRETDDVNTMYNYFVYALEYVKLARNILNPVVAANLIDDNGNISNYTHDNEIVQFRISNEDITLNIGR